MAATRKAMLLAGAALFSSPALGAPPAAPQAASEPARQDEGGIKDIIVTARRTTENVQDVPVSITAVGARQLVDLGVRQASEIQAVVPNLYVSSTNNGGRAEFSIRGQRDIEGTLVSDSPVGIYVDGVNFARQIGVKSSFVDIDQVAVLRGPQGTLFGKNTTGGAVLITTRKPTQELGGYIDLLYGNHDTKIGTVALNVPAGPDLAIRGVAQITRLDGYGRNAIGEMLDDEKSESYRLQALYKPSDHVSLLLAGDYTHMHNNGGTTRITYVRPYDLTNPVLTERAGSSQTSTLTEIIREQNLGAVTPATLAAAQALLVGARLGTAPIGFHDSPNDDDLFDNVKLYGASATLDAAFGDVAFKSITGYRHYKRASLVDYDTTPYVIVQPLLTSHAGNFSEELQLSSQDGKALDWIVGGFFNRESGNEGTLNNQLLLLIPSQTITDGDVVNKNYAAFGQAIYNFSDRLRLTGGLRYTTEKKSIALRSRSQAGVCQVNSNTPGACLLSDDLKFSRLSYLASLDYRPSRDILAYAKTSRAFRGGGFNLRAPFSAGAAPFAPETATDYEAGLKIEALDRRLRVNLDGFYTKYRNIQKSALVVFPNPAGGPPLTGTFLSNAAKGHIYGGEIEITAAPADGLTLNANGGWTHARYDRFVEANGNDRTNEPFSIPKFTYSLGATYRHAASFGVAHANINYNWRDDVNLRPTAAHPSSVTQRAYGLLDARIGAEIGDSGFDVSLYVKNATNKKYITGASDFEASLGFNIATGLGAPRTFGLQVRKTFGGG